MDTVTKSQINDIKLLGKFVEVYCIGKHHDVTRSKVVFQHALKEQTLCPECAAFLEYAIMKRMKCPLEEEKPACKHCRIHCYDKSSRDRARKIMAYAGRRLMMRGRIDYLWHYFF